MANKAAEAVKSVFKNFIPGSSKPTETGVPAASRRELKKVIKTFKAPIQFGTENGHQIFVYTNIRTNQVVYSLTRALDVRLHFARTFSLRPTHWRKLIIL